MAPNKSRARAHFREYMRGWVAGAAAKPMASDAEAASVVFSNGWKDGRSAHHAAADKKRGELGLPPGGVPAPAPSPSWAQPRCPQCEKPTPGMTTLVRHLRTCQGCADAIDSMPTGKPHFCEEGHRIWRAMVAVADRKSAERTEETPA